MPEASPKKRWILPLASACGVIVLIGIWALVSFLLKRNGNNVVPYPWDTAWQALKFLFGAGAGGTWGNIGWTFLRLAIGYIIAFLLASLLGTLAGLYPVFRAFFRPWVGFAKAVPTAAVVIVLIGLFFGPRNVWALTFAPSFLTLMVAFPLLYEAFMRGIQDEDPIILDALRLDGGVRRVHAVRTVLWPDSRPYIRLALAQSLGLSLKVSVMSEILTANSSARAGIGGLISLTRQDGNIEEVMAYALIALLLMLFIDIPYFLLRKERKRAKAI